MLTSEKLALEVLIKREITEEESSVISPLLEQKKYDEVGEYLSRNLYVQVQTQVGNGTILETLGFTKGNALLDLIDTDPQFKHVKQLFQQGRLFLNSPLTQTVLQSLVGSLLTQEDADKFKPLYIVKKTIKGSEVAKYLDGNY